MHSIFLIYLPFLCFEAYFWWLSVIIEAKAIIANCCCRPSTLKKNFFNWRLITLQYCGGFCHASTWISHGCTCVSHPEPLSHLPPHPIPLGHPSAPALSALSHAWNLDWWSILHMVIYTFQCYSLKSSYPRPLPQNPKVCSLSVSFAVSHIRSLLPSF